MRTDSHFSKEFKWTRQMKGKQMHGWEVIRPDHITWGSVPGKNCGFCFHSTMLFSLAYTASKAGNRHPSFEGISIKNCLSPPHTCWRLPLPAVLVAAGSMWALHNLQKAESTKLNWTTSEDKLSSSIFLILIRQCSHALGSWQSSTWSQPSVSAQQQAAVWKGGQGSPSSTWATVC